MGYTEDLAFGREMISGREYEVGEGATDSD